jgi:hypothetical protein
MRLFDLAEANRLVPLLVQTFTSVRDCLESVQTLSQKLENETDEGARRECVEEREAKVTSIHEQISRIEDLGIEVKALDGLVDFRAVMNGRTVYLCWKFPESEISTWHELDGGFAGRRPLDQGGTIAPSYLS